MNVTTGTAEVKARLSEFLGRVRHGGERVIITRRGKPVAAIVSMDDLRRLGGVQHRDAETALTEQDGVLVLSTVAENSLEEVVKRDREDRNAHLRKRTGL